MTFLDMLRNAEQQNGSMLCVGLDPEPARFPAQLKGDANKIYDFCARIDAREELPIDDYAGESPAEFFAVMSEVFFEHPQLLADLYPAVYEQLARFYRQDPRGRVAAAAPVGARRA